MSGPPDPDRLMLIRIVDRLGDLERRARVGWLAARGALAEGAVDPNVGAAVEEATDALPVEIGDLRRWLLRHLNGEAPGDDE